MRGSGTSKTAVWRWQERFMLEGVAGLLRDRTRPSRIPPLSAEVEATVVQATLADPASLAGEVHRPGGGCPTLLHKDPALLESLKRSVEPATMGDPMRPLMWVSKSQAKLAAALRDMGHKVADSSIPKLLGLLKFCRKVNHKTLEGSRNPDRNAQFEHINAAVIATQATGQPVISIDAKKKKLIDAFKNGGSEARQTSYTGARQAQCCRGRIDRRAG